MRKPEERGKVTFQRSQANPQASFSITLHYLLICLQLTAFMKNILFASSQQYYIVIIIISISQLIT